ncbi:hypothetical protein CALCODRAFT_68821 [Calocera cornea HHB12733]|uniref:Uncharacterized protein n=1 Tax=Calocera cornea HHB12733 TaxID=1353952 RepID=A0A165DJB6_9BASI|nr:hypothetical protein CALCODRAFT_68821 [Calocera cornea HHB12733]
MSQRYQMAGNTRSASDGFVLPSVNTFSPLQQLIRKNFSFKSDFIRSHQQPERFRPPRLVRFLVTSKTAPSAMQTVAPISPISPSAGVTAADVNGFRQRSLSFAPKTPSRLSRSSLPLSPPVTPDKQRFPKLEMDSAITEDGEETFDSSSRTAGVVEPLSFAASSQRKWRKGPPAALDLSPDKRLALSKSKQEPNAGPHRATCVRLDGRKLAAGIARRGGQVPLGIVTRLSGGADDSLSHNGPIMPTTPKSVLGANMGIFGLGIVTSPLPLSARSPPAPRSLQDANISHAQASAVAPITALHRGRQMTFSPLPPEPDELGRCTLIDDEGEPVTVYPRELQNWLFLPWVYWGMVCGRTFNLWFEPRQ